ncbi:MAG: alpha-glucosidase [Rhodobacterales bacterium]|nr:MAG: alpha-glucosidase [Rhodobacterales bacterium]
MTHLAKDPDWWRGAVIYQIYPRSCQDSNGDGIGDLPGIVRRLPYIASLGVDAIWISPFFTSPMKDFGYDVADYCDVDPMFGTLADFDAVVETAHGLGLKVMIDLVLSHTSDQHPWFVESRASRDNPKADWYVWADAKPDGTPPNNWLSIFGGAGWQWDGRRMQYYQHNFLREQPDLNFHNPAVQAALLGVARFWLDRGVDGFRLDTVNFYACDRELRDNPALPEARRNATIAPVVNPYNWQDHLHDKNQPETLDFLKQMRTLMNGYNAAMVGELGDAQHGPELIGDYTAGDDHAHMCYGFELLSGERPDAARIAQVLKTYETHAPDGWVAWAFSNHDVVRHATRWGLGPAAQRGFATLMMFLHGSACLYQGEELGLPEAGLAFDDLQDPYGIEFWPEYKGRDGCRTPMVWETAPNGGFTSAARGWLPVAEAHLGLSVAAAEAEPASILHHYRRAIAFRRANAALQKGALEGLDADGPVLGFIRSHGTQDIFFALNMGDEPATITVPEGAWHMAGEELGSARPGAGGEVNLDGWQPCIMRRAGAEEENG